MQIKALNKRILVRCPSIEEDVNERGYTTEVALASGRKIVSGTVVVASGAAEHVGIVKGTEIYFPRYSANEFPIKGKMFFSLSLDDVEFIVIKGDKDD